MSDPVGTCCLLTPPGAAALAVVEISGAGVDRFLADRFSAPVSPSRCVHGTLADETGEIIDDPVVVLAPDRISAEISLHGGPWVVQATLDLLQRFGFSRVDSPQNRGPLVDQVEAMVGRSLPMATTELGVAALLAQPGAWRAAAKSAPLEGCGAWESDKSLYWLLHPPTVAIVGPANVGKSTLANRLLAQDRSIVADLPGTTRDWVGECANLDGLPVLLVDTPGLRSTTDPIEHAAIEGSGAVVASADLVVLVLDGSIARQPGEAELLESLPAAVRVLNKCDLPEHSDWRGFQALRASAGEGRGVRELVDAIHRHFGLADFEISKARWWDEDSKRALLARMA